MLKLIQSVKEFMFKFLMQVNGINLIFNKKNLG